MRPTGRLLKLVYGLVAISVVIGVARVFQPPEATVWWLGAWLFVLAAFACIVLTDWLVSRNFTQIECTRVTKHVLSLGVKSKIELYLSHAYPQKLSITLVEWLPDSFECQSFPKQMVLAPNQKNALVYQVLPNERGNFIIEQPQLFIRSWLKLLEIERRPNESSAVKVYPNFMAISNLAFLNHQNQSKQTGLHLIQRRGEGMDFHQLRDFREGDSSRQVDWNASSRLNKLISKEFQDERDQQVVFVLDCGRRMRAKDGNISHFDYVLNAVLFTAYIAIKQGDAAGYQTFAGSDQSMLPKKGPVALNTLIHQLYDLHSSMAHSDFDEVAKKVKSARYKRSLVVIVTNLQPQDEQDLLNAVTSLQKQHLVLVASVREQVLDLTLDQPVNGLEHALGYAGTQAMMMQRHKTLLKLRAAGVIVADCLAKELPAALANQYLILKRTGRF